MKKTVVSIILSAFFILPLNAQQENPSPDIMPLSEIRQPAKDKLRITLGGGYANSLGSHKKRGYPEFDNIIDNLQTGFHIDLDIQRYLNKKVGVGLNTFYIKYHANGHHYMPIASGAAGYDNKESYATVYIAPTFITRLEKNRLGFYLGAGIGAIYCKADYKRKPTGEQHTDAKWSKEKLNHYAFGCHLSASVEYHMTKYTGAGVKLSAVQGMSETKAIGLSKHKHGLSNLLVSAFISFRK